LQTGGLLLTKIPLSFLFLCIGLDLFIGFTSYQVSYADEIKVGVGTEFIVYFPIEIP